MKKIFNEKQRMDEILGAIQKIQDEQEWMEDESWQESPPRASQQNSGQQNASQKSKNNDNDLDDEWREVDEDNPFEFGEEDELDLDIGTPDDEEYAELICPKSLTLCQGLAQVFLNMKISEFFGEDSEAYEAYLKDNPEVDPSWMTMDDIFEMAYDYIDRYHWRGEPEYQEHYIRLTEPIIRVL